MMRLAIAIGLFYVSSLSGLCRAADKPESPRAAVEKWAKAFDAGSAAEMLQRYAKSKDLLVIISSGRQYVGYDALKKEYETTFRDVRFSKSRVTEVKAKQDDNVAWVSCRHQVQLFIAADKSRWQLEVRTTFVLKKYKEGWRIALEHSSPIAGVSRLRKQ